MTSCDFFTVDELVSILQHTSIPSLLVEGRSDMSPVRHIEKECGLDVLPCGGRDALFQLHDRRNEFESEVACIFLADRDTWVFNDSIPEDYRDIVFTTGYSIENDALYESDIEGFYQEEEIKKLGKLKSLLSIWWANELELLGKKGGNNFNRHIKDILEGIDKGNFNPQIRAKYYVDKGLRPPINPTKLSNEILNDFELKMRGHQLLQLYELVLEKSSNAETRSVAKGIMHISCVMGNPPLLDKLAKIIRQKLDEYTPIS